MNEDENDALILFVRYQPYFDKVGLPHPHRVLGCQGEPLVVAAVPPVDYRLAVKHLMKELIFGNLEHLN